MKCEVDRELFAECLQGVLGTIPARTTYPVLQNIMVEIKANRMIVTATDLDTWVRKEIPVASGGSAVSGKAVLPGKKLMEVTGELEEPLLVISQVNSNIKLESGKNVYTFAGLDPAEFPEPPPMPTELLIDFPLPVLEEAVGATAFSASKDETRPAMTGVCWEVDPKEMRMVATDGHRLAFIRTAGDFKVKARMIIPPKVFELFTRGEATVKIKTGSGKIGLEFANTTITSRLIEGPYPDYDRVIPKSNPNKLKVGRDKLAASLRRTAVFANPIAKPVTFDLKEEGSLLFAETPELGQGQDTIPGTYAGEPIKTAFNANFMQEILRHINTPDVTLELGTQTGAGVIRPDAEKPDRLYLLMPIRMD